MQVWSHEWPTQTDEFLLKQLGPPSRHSGRDLCCKRYPASQGHHRPITAGRQQPSGGLKFCIVQHETPSTFQVACLLACRPLPPSSLSCHIFRFSVAFFLETGGRIQTLHSFGSCPGLEGPSAPEIFMIDSAPLLAATGWGRRLRPKPPGTLAFPNFQGHACCASVALFPIFRVSQETVSCVAASVCTSLRMSGQLAAGQLRRSSQDHVWWS